LKFPALNPPTDSSIPHLPATNDTGGRRVLDRVQPIRLRSDFEGLCRPAHEWGNMHECIPAVRRLGAPVPPPVARAGVHRTCIPMGVSTGSMKERERWPRGGWGSHAISASAAVPPSAAAITTSDAGAGAASASASASAGGGVGTHTGRARAASASAVISEGRSAVVTTAKRARSPAKLSPALLISLARAESRRSTSALPTLRNVSADVVPACTTRPPMDASSGRPDHTHRRVLRFLGGHNGRPLSASGHR
jgi:hypothetical protein